MKKIKIRFFSKNVRFFRIFGNSKKIQVQNISAFSQWPAVNIWAIIGRSWVDHGQIMGRSWANHGQIMGRSWADHGQIMGDRFMQKNPENMQNISFFRYRFFFFRAQAVEEALRKDRDCPVLAFYFLYNILALQTCE